MTEEVKPAEPKKGPFKYRAIRKGQLNRPFKVVEEGEVFTSPVELKGSWFQDADLPLPKKSSIIVPYMKIDGRVQRPENITAEKQDFAPRGSNRAMAQDQLTKGVPPVPVSPAYKDQMEAVIAGEKARDAAAEKPKAEGETTKPAGTGNQSVI
jgi:hypothetical protein